MSWQWTRAVDIADDTGNAAPLIDLARNAVPLGGADRGILVDFIKRYNFGAEGDHVAADLEDPSRDVDHAALAKLFSCRLQRRLGRPRRRRFSRGTREQQRIKHAVSITRAVAKWYATPKLAEAAVVSFTQGVIAHELAEGGDRPAKLPRAPADAEAAVRKAADAEAAKLMFLPRTLKSALLGKHASTRPPKKRGK